MSEAADQKPPPRAVRRRHPRVPAGQSVVSGEQLRRVYGRGEAQHVALDDVSLNITAGEVVLIVGPSGSGKSTLLGLIGGLDRDYRGQLRLFGQDPLKLGDRALSQLRGERIGFVFQSFHLLEHLSVIDNVRAPFLFGNDSISDELPRAEAALQRVGLIQRAQSFPHELSGGQRQRVAIARAFLREPELLLCDEPTGNLDQATGEQIIDLFEELHEDLGTTIVVVTHEARLDRIAHRSLNMLDGKLTDEVRHRRAEERQAPPATKVAP